MSWPPNQIKKCSKSFLPALGRIGSDILLRHPVIVLACLLLVVCLVIGADYYRAAAALTASKEIVIADKRRIVPGFYLLTGGDTCGSATVVSALPYNDTGTTVGMADNYDLPTAFTAPTVTGCPTCNATGGGPAEAAPRGGVFLGTGTGPDVAYSITFTSSNNSIDVTLTPTGSEDLALIVYTDVCSNSLSDAIVVDDDDADGEAEHVVVSNMPAGTYNIIVDAYSTGGTSPGPSGPYSIAITGTGTIAGGTTPTPTATATVTNTPTSTPTPSGPIISGTVTYGNAAAPPKYISNVTVTGTGSPNVSTTTAAPGATAGQYTLTGFGSGSYTVSLSKTTGQNSITSFDAARVAQHVASTSPLTTNNQKVTADVSGNGTISSQDAAKIAQYAASIPGAPPNLTGTWQFYVPPGPTFPIGASATTRTYPSVPSSVTGEDYIGLLIGEVTGNWTPGAARPAVGPERSVAVKLPNLWAGVGEQIGVPVKIDGAANKEVIAYEFDLRYDPTVIQPDADVIGIAGTASRAMSIVVNPTEPGLLRVVVYGAMPITENGLLLNLRFIAVGSVGAISPLSFERIIFNEGDPPVIVANGKVQIVTGEKSIEHD